MSKEQGLSIPLNKAPRVRLVRSMSFSAAHRYFQPRLSDEENKKIFGELYRQDGFGHNFVVELHVEGEVHPDTGMLINLSLIDQWFKEVLGDFDHRDLNQVTALSGRVPTPEVLALTFAKRFSGLLDQHLLELSRVHDRRSLRIVKMRVYEGDDVWADAIL